MKRKAHQEPGLYGTVYPVRFPTDLYEELVRASRSDPEGRTVAQIIRAAVVAYLKVGPPGA